MTLNAIYVESIGLSAPGFASWNDAAPIFKGEKDYSPQQQERYKPTLLPPNERRRATDLVRLAFKICEEAVDGRDNLDELSSVFASSGGDYPIIDQICRALTTEERAVSPTQFHNSVHNSAAGYWSIATKSRKESTSLCAYDASFAVGLLETATKMSSEQNETLLACCDTKPPEPIHAKRRITDSFGVAMLFAPKKTETSLAAINVSMASNDSAMPETTRSIGLWNVQDSNPAARCLPVLELISRREAGLVYIEMPSQSKLAVRVSPC